MFLTCLLNSSPPALNRNSFGILFHCFAAKYLKEFNPYFVVFTFGSDSVLLPLKSYLLFLILTSSLMHVGAVPWKQAIQSSYSGSKVFTSYSKIQSNLIFRNWSLNTWHPVHHMAAAQGEEVKEVTFPSFSIWSLN